MALITFLDALDAVQDFVGTNALARAQRDVRRAVADAYDEILQARNWRYYRTQWGFATVASYSTGTITYDHSGHASGERIVTLATGTWPSWAERGTIRANSQTAEVERRISDTLVQLAEGNDFGDDLTGGDDYTLVCDHYLLPDNFRGIGDIYGDQAGWWSRRITPEEYLFQRNNCWSVGEPWCYCDMQDRTTPGRTALYLYPAPSTLKTYDLIISEAARPLRWLGNESAANTGTITIAAGATAMSGSGTSFHRLMEGSVIRPGTTSALPTGIEGSNPYVEQFVIKKRTDATNLIVTPAAVDTYTATTFIVSDPIDMEAQMQKAFIALCKVKICAARPNDMGDFYQIVAGEYARLLQAAECTDTAKSKATQYTGGLPYWRRLASFPSDGV